MSIIMIKNKTNINWVLHSHCKAECFYCPSKFKNGNEPKHVSEYIIVAKKLIDHFYSLHRNIHWNFDGGELLDMFDFPEFLKFCNQNDNTIEITTNGGKLWLDWWAIEPYVDILHLTYHYWQNYNLIKFIIQTFQKNNKKITITIPLRPKENFNIDFEKISLIKNEFNIDAIPLMLNKVDSYDYLNYDEDQFEKVLGNQWVNDNIRKIPKTVGEKFEQKLNSSPSFTGKLCNVGIEHLNITPEGWVKGSNCNNLHLGNIWDDNFSLPSHPSKCKMISCIDVNDQRITKFI